MKTAETINICKFMPVGQKDDDAISVIRFVRETDRNIMKKSRLASSYSMGLVLTGKGALLKNETAYSLTENDLFLFSRRTVPLFPGGGADIPLSGLPRRQSVENHVPSERRTDLSRF